MPPRFVVMNFFFNDTATTEIYTLSLHDALPISSWCKFSRAGSRCTTAIRKLSFPIYSGPSPATIAKPRSASTMHRSEEHTSELQSPCNLVCRLLLEKKKKSLPNLESRDHKIGRA